MKKSIALLLGALLSSTAMALDYEQKSHKLNVFAVNAPGKAEFSYTYMPYQDWVQKGSGGVLPMDVAPQFSALARGPVTTPPLQPIDESRYTDDREQKFVQLVKERDRNGRPQPDLAGKTPQQKYAEAEASTYVVEFLMSTVMDHPVSRVNLTQQTVADLPSKIDVDHFHFQIPGSLVEDVPGAGSSLFAQIRPERNYLLSIFDLSEYQCAVMADGVEDYFSGKRDGEPLHNKSIYVISQLDLNGPGDLDRMAKYFGRKPDLVVRQQTLYADHAILGGETFFAFFSEGQRTRVVLLSELAMKSHFFTGAKGLVLRQYLLDGFTGGPLGAVTGKVLNAKDEVSNLLAGANADVSLKNACNHGLALGLIRYSQSLFTEFTNML